MFKDNKEILKYCPNYYKIINEEYSEDDLVSQKVVEIYVEFVFSVNPNSKRAINELVKLNETVTNYFLKEDFRRELSKVMVEMKIKRNIDNVLLFIIKSINETYEKYLESYTRNIYIPRWI